MGQREMDLLAQVGRAGGGWTTRAVIISKGQKGIRRGREVEARYSGQLLGHGSYFMYDD